MRNARLDVYKLESRLPGEISDMQMIITLMAESKEELMKLLVSERGE